MSMTRRNFMGVTLAAGALSVAGTAVAEPATTEQTPETLPWSGPGSAKGDWVGTPEDIKALGGCTMPLDELNRRRQMYIDAQGEWTCADGTVIPAPFVKVRALTNTYCYGQGSSTPEIVTDANFAQILRDFTLEEAEAYIEMPFGKPFTSYEFAVHAGRDEAECEAICESLAGKAWLHRSVNDKGVHYCHIPFVQGFGEYHMPELHRGECDLGELFSNASADGSINGWILAGDVFINILPCDKSVVKDEAIDPLDEIKKIWATKKKFSLSPCFCRYINTIKNGTYEGLKAEMVNFPDGDFDLTDLVSPDCGHEMMTCLSCGEEAQFWIDHHCGREISYEEAMARLERSVELGFIIEVTNSKEAETICSCHGDCCNIMTAYKGVAPAGSVTFRNHSRYLLEVETETCAKCGACAERCPMDAITMNEETGLPEVTGVCVTCGQCAYICPTKSRWLVHKPADQCLPKYEDCIDANNMLAAQRFEAGLVM